MTRVLGVSGELMTIFGLGRSVEVWVTYYIFWSLAVPSFGLGWSLNVGNAFRVLCLVLGVEFQISQVASK